jgi:hypothetical protein
VNSFLGFNFEVAVEVFYESLEEQIPGSSEMFPNMHTQKVMLISALRCIDHLFQNDVLLDDYMSMLGEKHLRAGVTAVHMEAGRVSFEKALDAAGPDIDEDRRLRFIAAFEKLQKAMGY